MAFSALNWKELALWIEKARPEIESFHVDKIVVPERPEYPQGYLKSEWVIRLLGRKQERSLLVSLRPRWPYLALVDGKTIRASTRATHSPFEQALSKAVRGRRLDRLEVMHRERSVILWFSEDANREIGWVLQLIPSAPEGFLIERTRENHKVQPPPYKILARTRTVRDPAKVLESWTPPDGSRAPENLEVRSEGLQSAFSWFQVVQRDLAVEAFGERKLRIERFLRDAEKQARDKLRQSETAIREAESEPDWKRFGDLFQLYLYEEAPPSKDDRVPLLDPVSEETIWAPRDPRLNPTQQLDRYYQLARRKQRRLQESGTRKTQAEERLQWAQAAAKKLGPLGPSDLDALKALEMELGVSTAVGSEGKGRGNSVGLERAGQWTGKSFISKDGFLIWVGRSRAENLELTFKCSRGNDVWLHLRGRPGAHVLIPVPAGKTVPLETLLDAAVLTVYYSGGEKWGKTEVDYTFKKHVKRIKDSTEASYTHNKTLIVAPEVERLKRLLG